MENPTTFTQKGRKMIKFFKRLFVPRTPVTKTGIEMFDHLTPEEAVRRAWNDPGSMPYFHTHRKEDLHDTMPLLARALDRL